MDAPVIMPWGKYRDQPLWDVPLGYLSWCLRTCELDGWLRAAIADEVERRCPRPGAPRWTGEPKASAKPADCKAEWAGIVRTWYRRLAMKHHPDRGGSHEAMVAVNDAHELLKQLAGL